ncbi:MAG: hypothetical protein HY298_26810 [Verrucomicrobia bacterium]|nr:hypothetical protein [Verrucomicrobiota bacterium]
MSMAANKGRLEALTKELLSKWAQTKYSWRDAKSQEFEQRFMDELLSGVNRTVSSIQELEKTMNKVRSDCE